MLRNTPHRYGSVAISLHWLVTFTVIGLFALGLWMVELDYYHPQYKAAPDLHKSIGLLLFAAVALRWLWRQGNAHPAAPDSHSAWEKRLAACAHSLLYLLLFTTMLAGYLISTADGRSIEVFGWFAVPALPIQAEQQEDIAGTVHLILAIALISLAALHMLAALKHHFFDRDQTLRRMLGRG